MATGFGEVLSCAAYCVHLSAYVSPLHIYTDALCMHLCAAVGAGAGRQPHPASRGGDPGEISENAGAKMVPNKMQHILCTGNMVTKEQYDEFRALAPNVHVVAGDLDQEPQFPETKVITIGQFRIGLCHGHQVVPWGDHFSLAALQRKMNVDILVTGHTHQSHIRTENGKWFVNPGSITGAFSNTTSDVVPSFLLMAVQGPKVVAFLYELKGDNVVVSKSEFTKEN